MYERDLIKFSATGKINIVLKLSDSKNNNTIPCQNS